MNDYDQQGSDTPLKPLSPADAQKLRGFCSSAGYLVPNLLEQMGTLTPPPTIHHQWPQLLQRTAQPTAFNCLTRLFFLGAPIQAAALRDAMPDWFAGLCLDCGLLGEGDGSFEPRFLLSPCEDLWLAADLHQQRNEASGREHVLPVNAPAINLLKFLVRRPVATTLDLCSGMALHGLVASRFSAQVVASDLSPRAAMLAEFNAALNGCDNLECVSGDLFSRLGGRTFDLIMCNPPFVVSPSREFLYRDNPFELDEFCQRLIQEAPAYLNEDGYCQIVCEWVEVEGQNWQDRVRGWLERNGCDAWVLEANRMLPSTYVLERGREHETGNFAEDQQRFHTWLEYFSRHRVEAVYGGVITLRRRSGENWISFGKLTRDVDGAVGEAILQGVAARDFLQASASAEQLLACRPQISPSAKLEQTADWREGQWRVHSIILSSSDGIPVSIGIDEHLRDVLEKFDGRHSVAEVLEELAARLGTQVSVIRDDFDHMLRVLIDHGLLLPPAPRQA